MKYPKYIMADGYVGVFQYLDFGEFPVYRFPGGDRISCATEMAQGSDNREELIARMAQDPTPEEEEEYDPEAQEPRRGCKDCPDDECTGHCMSCYYRPV